VLLQPPGDFRRVLQGEEVRGALDRIHRNLRILPRDQANGGEREGIRLHATQNARGDTQRRQAMPELHIPPDTRAVDLDLPLLALAQAPAVTIRAQNALDVSPQSPVTEVAEHRLATILLEEPLQVVKAGTPPAGGTDLGNQVEQAQDAQQAEETDKCRREQNGVQERDAGEALRLPERRAQRGRRADGMSGTENRAGESPLIEEGEQVFGDHAPVRHGLWVATRPERAQVHREDPVTTRQRGKQRAIAGRRHAVGMQEDQRRAILAIEGEGDRSGNHGSKSRPNGCVVGIKKHAGALLRDRIIPHGPGHKCLTPPSSRGSMGAT